MLIKTSYVKLLQHGTYRIQKKTIKKIVKRKVREKLGKVQNAIVILLYN